MGELLQHDQLLHSLLFVAGRHAALALCHHTPFTVLRLHPAGAPRDLSSRSAGVQAACAGCGAS